MLTLSEYLMGRDEKYECPEEVKRNAAELLEKINRLLALTPYGERPLTSGWRPAELNATVKGAAPKSHHILGNAADVSDQGGLIGYWLKHNIEALVECGLYMENTASTPGWVHLQQLPPRSGSRIFIP